MVGFSREEGLIPAVLEQLQLKKQSGDKAFFPTFDSDPFALAGIVDPESDHETTVPEDRGHLNPCHNNNCESCRLGTLIGNTEKGQWDEMFDEAPTSYHQRCAKTQSRIKRGKVDGNSSEEK